MAVAFSDHFAQIVIFYDRDVPDLRSRATWPAEALDAAEAARREHAALADRLDQLASRTRGCGSQIITGSDPEKPFIFGFEGPGVETWHQLALYASSATALSMLIKSGKDVIVEMLRNKTRLPAITVKVGDYMVAAHSAEDFEYAVDVANMVLKKKLAEQRRRDKAKSSRKSQKPTKSGTARTQRNRPDLGRC